MIPPPSAVARARHYVPYEADDAHGVFGGAQDNWRAQDKQHWPMAPQTTQDHGMDMEFRRSERRRAPYPAGCRGPARLMTLTVRRGRTRQAALPYDGSFQLKSRHEASLARLCR